MKLIDADALKTKAETIQTIDCWHMRTEEQAVLVEHIDNAPTIDAVPKWIPCSERLPEEEGWYLVTIQNDKTEKRRTENDLFAIGIAEAHKLTPYKFCKDGHRQTVIAWMPLPEPYKGERGNDE